jgi:hypothetical protein
MKRCLCSSPCCLVGSLVVTYSIGLEILYCEACQRTGCQIGRQPDLDCLVMVSRISCGFLVEVTFLFLSFFLSHRVADIFNFKIVLVFVYNL